MYPGNIASTNHTGPRCVSLRNLSLGDRHSIPYSRRNEIEAKCSRFGSALRQNHSGSSSSASAAADCVTILTTVWEPQSSKKTGRISCHPKHESCERTIAVSAFVLKV